MNILIILFSSILTVYLMRFLKRTFRQHYFSLNKLIVSDEESLTIRGLLIIFAPILIGSIILSFFKQYYMFFDSLLYGAVVGFLIVWPIIQYPFHLLEYPAYLKKKTIFFIYILYIISCAAISLVGFLLNQMSSTVITDTSKLNALENWFNSLSDFWQWFWGIIATIAITGAYNYIAKGINKLIKNQNNGIELSEENE